MSAISPEKQTALAWVDANQKRLSDFHLEIWRYAETAFREYKSARAYCDLLRKEGFQVEEGSADMPTAFLTTFGQGRPVLGSYAEYDAVPENSQEPVPYRSPRSGLHPWAPGHTDPHSSLGVSALAGVLAAKAAMEKHKLPGTLRFFGEPAEKVCGSKPVHAAKGYYDGADAYVSYHPALVNTTVWETHCGSYWSAVFNGDCIGGGLELLLSTDIRAAAPHARFGLPEVRWSIYPFGGATVKLVQQIGYVHAMDLLLTARLVDAAEAARLGLVNRVVAAEALMSWALETAQVVAGNSPTAVQAVKQQISSTIADHALSREALEQELGDRVRASDHFREGVRAFLEKRRPDYT